MDQYDVLVHFEIKYNDKYYNSFYDHKYKYN